MLSFAVFLFIGVYTGVHGQNLLDPIPRECRTLGTEYVKEPIIDGTRNEYPAGGTLMALAQVPSGINGSFEFYLCLEEGNTDNEECLFKVPLQLGDGETRFNLSSVAVSGTFEIPVIIPDDMSCSACTLQWRVIVEDCPKNLDCQENLDCPKNVECQVMDEQFCADISVRKIKIPQKRIFNLIFGALKGVFGGG